jgi:signal transduction histidine kinase/ActR/RegA family two-component response regulator
MDTLIRKLHIVLGGSRWGRFLTLLFVAVFLVLLVMLFVQTQSAYRVSLPVGSDEVRISPHDAIPLKEDREILILNSYHPGYSWSDNEMAGIAEIVHGSGVRINLMIEYLDCKRYPKMGHFERLRDVLKVKYRSADIPVVIVTDNPALQFALRYRRELFPSSAIVFCGINGFTGTMIAGQRNITGTAELLDGAGTLELALRLHPQTRQVYVVHDYTITGLSTRRETEEQIRPFEQQVAIRYVENRSTGELAAFLRTLSPDSLVLALSYSLDKDGNVINHETISRLLSVNAPVPVYGLHEERLGYGIVGGSLLGGKMQGIRAAELALRVLGGENASTIPVDLKSPTRRMFDHNQLVRFGILDDAIPKDAVIVNRPVSFFSEYTGLVLTTLGMIGILVAGIVVLGIDIYQRKLAEGNQKKLQDQLLQAQKMEAVGHLAGGVAHDFNNILTAIMGYANLIRRKMTPEDPLRPFSDHILAASERAAKLVKNLLAFSRKQVIETKPVELNEIVKRCDKIISRLIGEDVEFTIILLDGNVTVMADAGQIEQVLLNLCTNARDAMPKGGRLVIETDRVTVDASSLKTHLLERTGVYGVISVSDTGTGMDEKTRRQIFEPFFTTKEVGKGTGLGLSTAYGIVKQHDGVINVYSEPGKGTTFRIYLPEVKAAGIVERVTPAEEAPGGSETVLLVEDDPAVRVLVALILRDAGYTVIEAADGEEAARKFQEHNRSIALLLTDVIMPKKNGREIYDQVRAIAPSIKVLFISGYTADIIKSRGILDDGYQLLSKPLVPDKLLRVVRTVLEERPPAS